MYWRVAAWPVIRVEDSTSACCESSQVGTAAVPTDEAEQPEIKFRQEGQDDLRNFCFSYTQRPRYKHVWILLCDIKYILDCGICYK